MPIRMLRDCTDSEAVNRLDDGSEVLFYRLIMKADDYGRFTANPRLIRSLCFPLKDGIRESDISRRIAACESAGLIVLYQVADKPLLEIVNFGQRLRSSRAKYPPPPVADGCGNVPTVADGCRLNGNRTEPESETELETEGRKNGSLKTFALWANATAKELRTPAGAQRLFEHVRSHGLCTDDEQVHVFRLVFDIKDDPKVKNLVGAITNAIRGAPDLAPWRARGLKHEAEARDWIRSLKPPEIVKPSSNLEEKQPDKAAAIKQLEDWQRKTGKK